MRQIMDFHKIPKHVQKCEKCGRLFATPYDLDVHLSQPCSTPQAVEKATIREKKKNPIITEKICRRCLKEKPISEFEEYKKNDDGISQWCRDCEKELSRLYGQ